MDIAEAQQAEAEAEQEAESARKARLKAEHEAKVQAAEQKRLGEARRSRHTARSGFPRETG
jgi:hypothetical protein